MVTLVKPYFQANALEPILTTGLPSMVAGITTAAPVPVYLVIITVPPDTVYEKSPDCRAKAILGKTKTTAIMTE